MIKKKTIGVNPLEAYLASHKDKSKEDVESDVNKPEATKKQRITIHVAIDLIDRVKNAVYWEPGLTLTQFAQEAFEEALKQREKKRGEEYPERKVRALKSGRPLL